MVSQLRSSPRKSETETLPGVKHSMLSAKPGLVTVMLQSQGCGTVAASSEE